MGAGRSTKALAGAMAATMLLVNPMPAFAEDKFDVFTAHDDENTQHIGYDNYDVFLDTFGVKRGKRLNLYYSAMRPKGLKFLDSYRDAMARVSPATLSRHEQLAYWLNLRNILIIRAIAYDPPGRSLKGERGDASDPGEMWTRRRVSVEDVSLSINDIEQNIILRNFNDPNLIYGLYQGVQGGPTMWDKGFRGATIQEDLKALGEKYVNESGVIRVRSSKVRAPLVYHWYKEALFDGDDSKVIEHLTSLAKPQLRGGLEKAFSLGKQKFSYSLDEHQVRQQRQISNRPPSSIGSRGGSGS